MNYPLEDLLRVRNLREDRAQDEFLKARNRLKEANLALDRATQELEDYKVWLIEEEKRRYDTIMNQEVNRHKVDSVKLEVKFLRKKEQLYIEKVKEAEANVSKAAEELEQTKEVRMQSIRDRKKIDEHKENFGVKSGRKEQEFLAEKEMEDFRTKELEEQEEVILIMASNQSKIQKVSQFHVKELLKTLKTLIIM